VIDGGLVLGAALGPRDAALDAEAGAVAVLGVELSVGLAKNYGIVPDGVPQPKCEGVHETGGGLKAFST